MDSPPLLAFDEFLPAIPGENPAGTTTRDLLDRLKEDRRENLEADPPKKPDWSGIVRLTQQTLKEQSKDLQVAAHLLEALVVQHGFRGLRDGLRLLRLLVDQCWENLNPAIEDGDLEIRAGPFTWLDDPFLGARFPSRLRTVPLVQGKNGPYGWQDWQQTQKEGGAVTQEDFEKAVKEASLAECERIAQELAESQEELAQLVQSLGIKMGPLAPGLTGLRLAIEEVHGLSQKILKKKRPVDSAEAAPTEASPEAGAPAGGATPGPRTLTSRADVYRQLEQAAGVLQQLEPHSPIPYLIKRAVELGGLTFPELIKALIRDPNVLNELSREFGLKEQPPPESS